MNKIDELHDICIKAKFSLCEWCDCVDWAVQRLVNKEDEDNECIILLASSNEESEIKQLTKEIIYAYVAPEKREHEYLAGKYVVFLHELFYSSEIDIFELQKRLLKIYCKLDYPSWLATLYRNCEYATDIQAFEKPFHDEFEYIVGLWENCSSITEFNDLYDRNISNSHDAIPANK
ncbi:MAG: hypothetical protein KZQ91_12295 [Candidatus Thiodiazotropha sp. (ex Lucinoma borealis)]|nr:hypothetical protein [Candidatus Thiodiazotropha sp. (ex Lucinoma borealis)]